MWPFKKQVVVEPPPERKINCIKVHGKRHLGYTFEVFYTDGTSEKTRDYMFEHLEIPPRREHNEAR